MVAATCRTLYAHTCRATNPCRSSCSATKFPCRWLPERNGLQSATNCDGIQNGHVVASVYDICNGIRDIAIYSCVSQATTCVGLFEKVQIK